MIEGITVGNVKKIERMSETGDFETVYRIPYKTDKGASGFLVVPERDYTKDRLRAILEQERDKANMTFELANEE